MTGDGALPDLVADLFRHRYARFVAGLCRILGPARLDLAEDVVQEAMVRALRTWPADGVPQRPESWVFRVARNLALDELRRRRVAQRVMDELSAWATDAEAASPPSAEPSEAIADDTLRMMFTCCHPDVPPEARVPLVLKTVCGFGVPAIAAALLQKEGTIAQRLTRAKARLQSGNVRFEVPPQGELPERLHLVHEVLYLMFNEGYRAHRGSDLVRLDVATDAVRLCILLLEPAVTATPATHALLALMLLSGARLPSRIDAQGELATLAEQDRSRWDGEWLRRGFHHFRRSLAGTELTPFHVEAAIASLHAAAPSYAATDWTRVLAEYDRLLQFGDSPVVRLNRAVALAKVAGPRSALLELTPLHQHPQLADYVLLPATVAHLHWELGEFEAAATWLSRALQRPCSAPETRLLQRRLEMCQRREPPPPW